MKTIEEKVSEGLSESRKSLENDLLDNTLKQGLFVVITKIERLVDSSKEFSGSPDDIVSEYKTIMSSLLDCLTEARDVLFAELGNIVEAKFEPKLGILRKTFIERQIGNLANNSSHMIQGNAKSTLREKRAREHIETVHKGGERKAVYGGQRAFLKDLHDAFKEAKNALKEGRDPQFSKSDYKSIPQDKGRGIG